MKRLVYVLPLLVLGILVVYFAIGLTKDPRKLPSTLLDRPVPEFALPAVEGRDRALSSNDLMGEVSLVNVFASWCIECRVEHPLLMGLAERGAIPIHGLNYKDKPKDAARWLDTLGDPYARTGADLDGRVGIDWGVYGVPETFLVDARGRVVYKHIGAITPEIWEDTLWPLVEELRKP